MKSYLKRTVGLGFGIFFLPVFALNHVTSFYLGALVGWSSANYNQYLLILSKAPATITDTGYATAFQIGYRVNAKLAAEMCAIYFQRIVITNKYTRRKSDGRFRNNMVYLVGKLSFPPAQNLKFFIKGGLGYIARSSVSYRGITVTGGELVRPVYGAGMNWRMANHWDLELTFMQARELATKQLPTSNYLGLGAHYLF